MVKKEDIEFSIDKAVSDYIWKCGRDGAKPTSGVIYGQGEAPKYELNDGGLDKKMLNQIADDMAERWGLEVSVDEKGNREISKTKFSLWDERHHTLIRLNKMIKHQDWIDFTNNGKANYNLDDVLRYYDELEPLAKTRMGALLFETNDGSSMNRLYHGTYGYANTVEISSMVYDAYPGMGQSTHGTNIPGAYHMKRVMGHEAGHAMERVLTKEQVDVLEKSHVKGSKNKFRKSQLTTDRERELYDSMIYHESVGRANDISGSKEWSDAQEQNRVKMSSQYANSYHYQSDRDTEDFAETMSAVAYRNSGDKSTFRIRYPDGREVGYDEFVSDHKATFQLACDYADGKIKHSDLHTKLGGEF